MGGERNENVNKVEVKGRATPDPEVLERARRRQFSAEYKLRILREADACGVGEMGALLRREGLYSSLLSEWRHQRERGTLAALAPKKRGRKGTRRGEPIALENERLKKENAKLAVRLRQAELIIDVQKKVSEMLGIPSRSLDNEGSDV
jgi:transposase-like protein